MNKVEFTHGGKEYDDLYPQGIPTSISITTKDDQVYDSGMVLFPGGHSQNETVSLSEILQHKFIRLGQLALEKEELVQFVLQLENIGELSNEELQDIYECNIKFANDSIDDEPQDIDSEGEKWPREAKITEETLAVVGKNICAEVAVAAAAESTIRLPKILINQSRN